MCYSVETKKAKPIIWRAEWVEEWRRTGKRPGPVMVWTSALAGESWTTSRSTILSSRPCGTYSSTAVRGVATDAGVRTIPLELGSAWIDMKVVQETWATVAIVPRKITRGAGPCLWLIQRSNQEIDSGRR